jgi:hypothetical protein
MGNSGFPTARISIHLNYDSKVPDCQEYGMKMNEIYITESCIYHQNDIHLHFSHQHYDPNRTFRAHYCYPEKKFYDSTK